MSRTIAAVTQRVLGWTKRQQAQPSAREHHLEQQAIEQRSRAALTLRSRGYRWEQVGATLGIAPEEARELAHHAVVQATRVRTLN